MKNLKHYLLFGLVMLSVGVSAQMTETEKAIKKAIENETKYYNERDWDAWSGLWIHSPNILWSVKGPEVYMEEHGWESFSAFVKKDWEENPEAPNFQQEKTDYAFSVMGDMAFVTFKENGNMSSRVMAKEDGQWKLMTMDVALSQAYHAQQKMTAMQNMAGIWNLDPSTVEIMDDNWVLDNAKCKVKKTNLGVKMYLNADWTRKSDGFSGTWKDEVVLVADSEANKVGALVASDGPFGSSVFTGECHFGDDYMKIKAHKMGTENVMKHKMKMKDDNNLKMHYSFYDKDGEKQWEMSFTLVKDMEASLAMN